MRCIICGKLTQRTVIMKKIVEKCWCKTLITRRPKGVRLQVRIEGGATRNVPDGYLLIGRKPRKLEEL